jgi:hypothetical protein
MKLAISLFVLILAGCGGGSMSTPALVKPPLASFFPLKAGDVWKFRDISNGGISTWYVREAPQGACGDPQFVIRQTKDRLDTYWGYGSDQANDWYVRIEPNGDIRSTAQVFRTPASTGEVAVLTTRTPNDMIIPANLQDYEQTAQYSIADGERISCGGQLTVPVYWHLSLAQSGDLLTVKFTEWPSDYVNGQWIPQPSTDYENWTFQRGVGPIKIENGTLSRHTILERIF